MDRRFPSFSWALIPPCKLDALHLSDMSEKPGEDTGLIRPKERTPLLLWVSGTWVLPLLGLAFWLDHDYFFAKFLLSILAILVAPLPALIYSRRKRSRASRCWRISRTQGRPSNNGAPPSLLRKNSFVHFESAFMGAESRSSSQKSAELPFPPSCRMRSQKSA